MSSMELLQTELAEESQQVIPEDLQPVDVLSMAHVAAYKDRTELERMLLGYGYEKKGYTKRIDNLVGMKMLAFAGSEDKATANLEITPLGEQIVSGYDLYELSLSVEAERTANRSAYMIANIFDHQAANDGWLMPESHDKSLIVELASRTGQSTETVTKNLGRLVGRKIIETICLEDPIEADKSAIMTTNGRLTRFGKLVMSEVHRRYDLVSQELKISENGRLEEQDGTLLLTALTPRRLRDTYEAMRAEVLHMQRILGMRAVQGPQSAEVLSLKELNNYITSFKNLMHDLEYEIEARRVSKAA